MKKRVEGRRVIHDHDLIIKQSKELSVKQDKGKYDALPSVVHPLVQNHPLTRRRCLFLSPHTMVSVEGMAEAEGRRLLDDLIAHAIQPKYVYRHVWARDDIIMWDNRCTMHSVEPCDNVNVRRIMHRVTLVGEGRPIAA
jgi:taurine dioxygenase